MLELYKIKKAGRDYEHPLGQLKKKRLFSGEKKKIPYHYKDRRRGWVYKIYSVLSYDDIYERITGREMTTAKSVFSYDYILYNVQLCIDFLNRIYEQRIFYIRLKWDSTV